MTHRRSFLLVLAVFVAFCAPPLLSGEVILAEGVSDSLVWRGREGVRTRSFQDHSMAYLPDLEHQLRGARSRWIVSWNPHVELGRPAWHMFSFTRAWLPTWILSGVTDDPFVLYTALALLAVLGTAVFGYLLLRSLDLHPAACALGTLGLALGLYASFWLTFVMYLWGVCWTLALLWLVPRFLERGGSGRGLGIAFALHSLLLCGYPQQTVWHGWLLLAVVGLFFARSPAHPGRWRRVAALAGWAALGLASVAPIYLDLILNTSRSARAAADFAFFAETLPSLATWGERWQFFTRLYDALWFGNPVEHRYPFMIRGISWTPLFAGLGALALGGGLLRRSWPWALFLVLPLVVTLWPAAYRFGIDYLGLGLSRHAPLAAAHIPLAVLAALAADRVVRGGFPRAVRASLVVALPLLLALPGVFVGEEPVVRGLMAAGLGVLLAALAFVWTRSPLLLVALALVSTLHYGFRLRMFEPRAEALVQSEVSQALHAATPGGERYAMVGEIVPHLLRPNQEVLFGLRSVHTYDSLFPRAYQEWVASLGSEGLSNYRIFRSFTDPALLDARALSTAAVGVLLAGERLPRRLARPEGRIGKLIFHRPTVPPVLQAQVAGFWRDGPGGVLLEAPPVQSERPPVERTEDRSDALAFRLAPAARETLLFVSQQYHPQWTAVDGEGAPLETVSVDGLYLGVVLPPGVEVVALAFRPWVLWSWIPSLAFVLLALLLGGAALRRLLRPPEGPRPVS